MQFSLQVLQLLVVVTVSESNRIESMAIPTRKNRRSGGGSASTSTAASTGDAPRWHPLSLFVGIGIGISALVLLTRVSESTVDIQNRWADLVVATQAAQSLSSINEQASGQRQRPTTSASTPTTPTDSSPSVFGELGCVSTN